MRPECPTKDCEARPAGNIQDKRPRGRPRARWLDYTFGLAWSHLGMESAELSEIAEHSEIFRVLLELLSPLPSPGEQWA